MFFLPAPAAGNQKHCASPSLVQSARAGFGAFSSRHVPDEKDKLLPGGQKQSHGIPSRMYQSEKAAENAFPSRRLPNVEQIAAPKTGRDSNLETRRKVPGKKAKHGPGKVYAREAQDPMYPGKEVDSPILFFRDFDLEHSYLLFECETTDEYLLRLAAALRGETYNMAEANKEEEDEISYGFEMFEHENVNEWLLAIANKLAWRDPGKKLARKPKRQPFRRRGKDYNAFPVARSRFSTLEIEKKPFRSAPDNGAYGFEMFEHRKTNDFLWAMACTLNKRNPNPPKYPKQPEYDLVHAHLLFECESVETCIYLTAQAVRNDEPLPRKRRAMLEDMRGEDDVAYGFEMFAPDRDTSEWLMDIANKLNWENPMNLKKPKKAKRQLLQMRGRDRVKFPVVFNLFSLLHVERTPRIKHRPPGPHGWEMFEFENTHDWLWAAACTLQGKKHTGNAKKTYPKRVQYDLAHSYMLFECDIVSFCLRLARALRNDTPPARKRLKDRQEKDPLEDDITYGHEMFDTAHKDESSWLWAVANKLNWQHPLAGKKRKPKRRPFRERGKDRVVMPVAFNKFSILSIEKPPRIRCLDCGKHGWEMFSKKRTGDWLFEAACNLQGRNVPGKRAYPCNKISHDLAGTYLLFEMDDIDECLVEMARELRNVPESQMVHPRNKLSCDLAGSHLLFEMDDIDECLVAMARELIFS